MGPSGNQCNGSPSIALVSPFDVWSAGIEAILRDTGWSFVGRWRDSAEAVDARATIADVLIIARRLVGQEAAGTRQRPFSDQFRGKLIVAVEPDDHFSVEDFLTLDAEGLILSSSNFSDFIDCIGIVSRGGMWIDPAIRVLLGHIQQQALGLHGLSLREQQVAQLAAVGLSNKRIARELSVSDGTVKMHMHHILAKLHLSSRFELMRPTNGFPSDFGRRSGAIAPSRPAVQPERL